jgi:hypothetical protein
VKVDDFRCVECQGMLSCDECDAESKKQDKAVRKLLVLDSLALLSIRHKVGTTPLSAWRS